MDNGYVHKIESFLKNETRKILWDFEIQTYHSILARRPNLFLINKKKKTNQLENFAAPA